LRLELGLMSDSITVRDADPAEIPAIAQIWYDAWRDAHAKILPAELARIRTLESFRSRLAEMLDIVRVAGERGRPLGFCIVKEDELYQLFVSAEARGKGVAAALISDGENTLADRGVKIAWLACAVGNDRAARFYEKTGWHKAGTVSHSLGTREGTIEFEVWRYEKVLL
jgi:GNAT superfamily N-acetyltransferase